MTPIEAFDLGFGFTLGVAFAVGFVATLIAAIAAVARWLDKD